MRLRSRVGEYLYGWNDDSLSSVVVRLLKENNLTLSCAESCTGGLLSYLISEIPGASEVLIGSTVCYTNQVKHEELGVPLKTLAQSGAVSEETAIFLADGSKNKYRTNIGVSITGVAGPTSQEEKPIGLVYIGLALPQGTIVKSFG